MKKTKDIMTLHEKYRNNTINLIASENIMSPLAREAMGLDMGHRYFFKKIYNTKSGISYEYNGTRYIKEMYNHAISLAKKLFEINYVEIFPISGHISNLSILTAFTEQNDTIMVTHPEDGGYPGLAKEKLPKYLGLNTEYIPFNKNYETDNISIADTITKKKIKILFLSSSWTLFPIPLEELSKICKENDCLLIYDASHPLGLIAGGLFQDPLGEGADYMVGSTHKTFPGPQGGIIMGNEYNEKISDSGHFVTADNIHFHRIASLAQTLEEMLIHGKEYAKQTIKNAQALAIYLYDEGLPIMYKEKGFTKSHQIKLNTDNFRDYAKFTSFLEDVGIIVDNSGRIGVNEVTRLGMKEKEMKEIAEYVGIIFREENSQKIYKTLKKLKERFDTVLFC